MATSLQCSFSNLTKLYSIPKPSKSSIVRSQAFRDPEGDSANMVDANLSMLRERINVAKKRDSLEKYCRIQNGWDYKHVCEDRYGKSIRHAMFADFMEIVTSVCCAIGFVFLTGSFSIFLVSFLVHMYRL